MWVEAEGKKQASGEEGPRTAPWVVLPQSQWEAPEQFYVKERCDWIWIWEALSGRDGEEGWVAGRAGTPAFSADPVALPPVSLVPLSIKSITALFPALSNAISCHFPILVRLAQLIQTWHDHSHLWILFVQQTFSKCLLYTSHGVWHEEPEMSETWDLPSRGTQTSTWGDTQGNTSLPREWEQLWYGINRAQRETVLSMRNLSFSAKSCPSSGFCLHLWEAG